MAKCHVVHVWARTQESALNKLRLQGAMANRKYVVERVVTAKYPEREGGLKYHSVHLKPRERRG